MLEGGGPVLGILPIAPYSEMHAHLDHGDMLVLYSDGVTEANNLNYDEFDEARFIEVLQANRRNPRRHCGSGDHAAGGFRRPAHRRRTTSRCWWPSGL